jgi:hypothetical protein
MQSMRYCLFILILAALALAGAGCEQIEAEQEPKESLEPGANQAATADDEPLLLDDEPPLLLDDDPDTKSAAGPGADNSRCFVCHINYMQEDIAVIHARANIGCKDCHGESDEHIADESWASGGNGTAPDIMYPRPKINPFCMGCHPKDKIDTVQHKPLFADTAEKKYCTDCHGSHRLTSRKCKWK